MSSRLSRPVGTSAAIVLASLMAACSPAASGSASQLPSPTPSVSLATPSPTAGPTSSTVPASAAPAGSIQVRLAGPPPHYEPAALTAPAGDIVFYLYNESLGIHNLAIGPALGQFLAVSANVEKDKAAVYTVRGLPPGRYMTWCTIDGHAAEGMVGTLTVK